jgi:predicted metal-dependent hydrolase
MKYHVISQELYNRLVARTSFLEAWKYLTDFRDEVWGAVYIDLSLCLRG